MPRSIGIRTLSDAQIKEAFDNGVRYMMLYHRIHNKKWGVDKAISTPPTPKEVKDETFYEYDKVFETYGNGKRTVFGPYELTLEQIETASRNGIRYHTLYNRLARKGWDVESATTVHPNPQGIKSDIYNTDQLALAESNGIQYDTLRKRLNRGWTMEDATTIPPDRSRRRDVK